MINHSTAAVAQGDLCELQLGHLHCQGRSLPWRRQEQDTAPANRAPPTGITPH